MRKLTVLLRIVAAIQIVLGSLYLFAPTFLLKAMGHTVPGDDIFYPLAMLAARFIGYGIALWLIAREPTRHALWIHVMIGIQLIDLAAGAFYTATGAVDLALSGFPMFNAAWIAGLLFAWRPQRLSTERAAPIATIR